MRGPRSACNAPTYCNRFGTCKAQPRCPMGPMEVSYRDLVGQLGLGFHPDIRGSEYVTLPEGMSASRLDTIVEHARWADLDVYAIALDVMAPMIEALETQADIEAAASSMQRPAR